INSELRGHERRQDGAIRSGMTVALARQRFACLHVSFKCCQHAIARIGARIFFSFTLGQCFGDSRKAYEPPSILLPLQTISITKGHYKFSKSLLVSPSWCSIACNNPGPIS